VATALLDIESRFPRRIKGHKHLLALREAMQAARLGDQATELQKAA
jgi:hypothetical protein